MLENEELQPTEVPDQTPVEGGESPAASAPAPEAEKPKYSPEVQEAISKEVGPRAAENRRLKRELEEAKKQLEAAKPVPQPVVVPPVPDALALTPEEHARQTAARDEALRKEALYQQQQQTLQQQQAELQRQRQEQAQREQQEKRGKYEQRAKTLGVTMPELDEAVKKLQEYGFGGDLVVDIIDDEDGPLLTKYLAQDPMEVDRLMSMDPRKAAVHLATVVKTKAAALKPKPTQAPDALDLPSGGRVPKGEPPELKGATFE